MWEILDTWGYRNTWEYSEYLEVQGDRWVRGSTGITWEYKEDIGNCRT